MKKTCYSADFAETITKVYGADGARWLSMLPALIEQCKEKWLLTSLVPVFKLTYNYLLFGKQGDQDIVLKLRCNKEELVQEAQALKFFQNHSGVRLIDYDEVLGALLIERIMPGTQLATLAFHDDKQATRIACELLKKLHAMPKENMVFPSLQTIIPLFKEDFASLQPFITQARIWREELLNAREHKPVALHGDFHHANILLSGNAVWKVVDPQGYSGDPCYDSAVFIRNPLEQFVKASDALALITERIKDFSEFFGYELSHLYKWTYLQAVTSAYWSLQDGLNVEQHIRFLQYLKVIEKIMVSFPSVS